MASSPSTIEYLLEQMRGAGAVSARKMFGEYALYCDGKLVALVCDDQLFVKPTDAGRALLGMPVEAPPYPGAKPCFLIDGSDRDEPDRLRELTRLSAAELPTPKPRRPRSVAAQRPSRSSGAGRAGEKT